MKIIKYTKLKSNKYKVLLSNNEEITLYDDVILNNNLLNTKEIKDINKLLTENTYYDAYFKAIKLLEKRLRTKKELIDYLKRYYNDDAINYAIKNIDKLGYLNNELYTKSYIHDQILLTNNGYYKILKDLKNRDIDEDIIKKYLDEVDNNIWLNKLDKIINKKISTNTKYSNKYLKEKILSDLNNLGYKKNDILTILDKKEFNNDSDILNKTYNSLYNKLSKKYKGNDLKLQLINKLMSKGFSYDKIKKLVD